MMLLAHLWQSTLCAALAALLAAGLTEAPGRVRHRIWLFASVKFLVPLSLLVPLGGLVGAWLPLDASPSVAIAVRWLDQSLPFWTLSPPPASGAGLEVNPVLTIGLLFAWAGGAAGLVWWRWSTSRALAGLARAAAPVDLGREADALHRASRSWPRTQRIALLICDANVEPGVRGVLRPQVIWPLGLSETLNDAELDAILAHELCHVHRRDNAVALLQMIVETLLWFHPVVWWLSARLVSERERACDEEVVQMGADKRSYAEGILKVCGFCLGAPIGCRVGVGHSGLAERIVRIMQHRQTHRLSMTRRVMLASVGVLVVAAPLMSGVLDARRLPVDPPDPRTPSSALTVAASNLVPGADGQQTVYPLSSGIKSPKLIKEAKPGYTAAAMRAGIHGSVVLEAVVRQNGNVGEVTVTKSLDSVYGLDDEAVKTVKLWRFEPGTKDGKPVAVRVEIEMTFTLRPSR